MGYKRSSKPKSSWTDLHKEKSSCCCCCCCIRTDSAAEDNEPKEEGLNDVDGNERKSAMERKNS